MEAFSQDWALSWCQALNGDAAYRSAAEGWEGDVTVVMTQSSAPKAAARAVRMDLSRGECLGTRLASEADLAQASFVLTATGATWRELFSGRQNPLMAVMTGKLRLSKGSLAALVPYAGMARELMRLAIEMNATIPEGWG